MTDSNRTRRGARPTLLTALLGLAAVGCAPLAVTTSATIPHPSQTPLVAPATQLVSADNVQARYTGLRANTLVDRAAIRSIEPNEICIQLALWAPPGQPVRNALNEYDLRLEAESEAGRVERESPRVERVGEWVEQRNRTVHFRFTRIVQQQLFPVSYRASDLCFENNELLTAETEKLRLVLRRGGRERRFEWRLDNGASYPRGVERAATTAIHPSPSDPMPQAQPGGYGAVAVGLRPNAQAGGLTALPYPTQQVPGGHPVDMNQLRALLRGQLGNLRLCLSRAAEQDPSLNRMRGTLVAELTVGPSGPANIRVVHNDFTPAAATCMQRHLAQLPIPADPMRWTTLLRYGITTENQGNL